MTFRLCGRSVFRYPSLACADVKRRCEPGLSDTDPCLRCARLGRDCVPSDGTITRRAREKTRKKERSKLRGAARRGRGGAGGLSRRDGVQHSLRTLSEDSLNDDDGDESGGINVNETSSFDSGTRLSLPPPDRSRFEWTGSASMPADLRHSPAFTNQLPPFNPQPLPPFHSLEIDSSVPPPDWKLPPWQPSPGIPRLQPDFGERTVEKDTAGSGPAKDNKGPLSSSSKESTSGSYRPW